MDNDPQPRAVLDPSFADKICDGFDILAKRDADLDVANELLETIRVSTAALYPEARIPETPMPYDPHRLSEIERASLQRAAPELYEALVAAEEELRLIRMKDTASVYNPALSTQISVTLAKARGER